MYELHKTSQCCIQQIHSGFKTQPYARQSLHIAVSVLEYKQVCGLLLYQQTRGNAVIKNWLKSDLSSLLTAIGYLAIHKVLALAQPI